MLSKNKGKYIFKNCYIFQLYYLIEVAKLDSLFILSTLNQAVGINSCGRSKHSDCSFFYHGYLEEEKSMIVSQLLLEQNI